MINFRHRPSNVVFFFFFFLTGASIRFRKPCTLPFPPTIVCVCVCVCVCVYIYTCMGVCVCVCVCVCVYIYRYVISQQLLAKLLFSLFLTQLVQFSFVSFLFKPNFPLVCLFLPFSQFFSFLAGEVGLFPYAHKCKYTFKTKSLSH